MTRRGWLGWIAAGGEGWCWDGDVFEAAAGCPERKIARQREYADGYVSDFPFPGDVEAVAETGGFLRPQGTPDGSRSPGPRFLYDYIAAGS